VEIVNTIGLRRRFSQVGVIVGWILFLNPMVQAEDHPAFMAVKELFAAMSLHDGEAMRATSTDDFQLLEHGEDWTMQQLVDAVQPNGNPYERKNFFRQIRARQSGDVAWLSYWNKAEIHSERGMRTIVWLESAVVVKEQDRWKVQLLHSTRLEPNNYPKDIEWVQFESTP
jgi:ketosteroid isomerase-like protein